MLALDVIETERVFNIYFISTTCTSKADAFTERSDTLDIIFGFVNPEEYYFLLLF